MILGPTPSNAGGQPAAAQISSEAARWTGAGCCAEHAAWQDEERDLFALFDVVPSGVALHEIILDAAGQPCDYRFLHVNAAFEAIVGLPRSDIIGRRAREIWPVLDAKWVDRYAVVALSGESRQFEEHFGDLGRCYRVTARCCGGGKFAAVFEDITMQRACEEALRLASTIFDETRDGVAITDANARILMVNPAFTEITGYESAEVVGRRIGMLKSGQHDARFYAAMWNALREAGHWQGELCNRRKSGETYLQWLTITALANASGESERYVGVFTDISGPRTADVLGAARDRHRSPGKLLHLGQPVVQQPVTNP